MVDDVKVGTCLEHEHLGVHVFGTFEDPVDGDDACVDFKEIPGFEFAHCPPNISARLSCRRRKTRLNRHSTCTLQIFVSS